VLQWQVNPHKRFRHLYGSRMRAQYRGKILGELSPHVYAIAEQVTASRRLCALHAVSCRTADVPAAEQQGLNCFQRLLLEVSGDLRRRFPA
jgi:hypothetical protein